MAQTPLYAAPEDWVFASNKEKGRCDGSHAEAGAGGTEYTESRADHGLENFGDSLYPS